MGGFAPWHGRQHDERPRPRGDPARDDITYGGTASALNRRKVRRGGKMPKDTKKIAKKKKA